VSSQEQIKMLRDRSAIGLLTFSPFPPIQGKTPSSFA
jgi:hypothetical protein